MLLDLPHHHATKGLYNSFEQAEFYLKITQ